MGEHSKPDRSGSIPERRLRGNPGRSSLHSKALKELVVSEPRCIILIGAVSSFNPGNMRSAQPGQCRSLLAICCRRLPSTSSGSISTTQ